MECGYSIKSDFNVVMIKADVDQMSLQKKASSSMGALKEGLSDGPVRDKGHK